MAGRMWCEMDRGMYPRGEFKQDGDRYRHTPPGGTLSHWADGLGGGRWTGTTSIKAAEKLSTWQLPSRKSSRDTDPGSG